MKFGWRLSEAMCAKHLVHCLAHIRHSKLLAIDLDTALWFSWCEHRAANSVWGTFVGCLGGCQSSLPRKWNTIRESWRKKSCLTSEKDGGGGGEGILMYSVLPCDFTLYDYIISYLWTVEPQGESLGQAFWTFPAALLLWVLCVIVPA